jgi:MOSC domain-containing protein YiiM
VSESGVIKNLWISPAKRQPMQARSRVQTLVGQGLDGCAHGGRLDRQVLLVEVEALDELGLTPGVIKENITTSGINLRSLPAGTQLQLGEEVMLEISQVCEPCQLMEKIRKGLMAELQGRRGMLARVRTGGTLAVGDRIRIWPSP